MLCQATIGFSGSDFLETAYSPERSIERLTQLALSSDFYTTLRACKALKQRGTIPSAFITALDDDDINTRWRAAIALQVLGKPAADHLMEFMNSNSQSRSAPLLWILGKHGDARAIPYLIDALNDEDSVIRYIAAESLGELGDTSVVDSLRQREDDPDEHVRSAVQESIRSLT